MERPNREGMKHTEQIPSLARSARGMSFASSFHVIAKVL
ncbi:hypothetical protein V1283_005495 [Bradyrhizobium sp. AZCC 2262]